MPRTRLREAREAADLTQEELATRIGAEKKAVSAWETGAQRPQPGHRRAIRDTLHNDDPDLFKNFESDSEEASEEEPTPPQPCHTDTPHEKMDASDPPLTYVDIEEPALLQPCHTKAKRDILESTGPYPFVIPGSVRRFRAFMDIIRRQFIEALAKFGEAKLFGDVSLVLVSSPVVAPDEYIKQCSVIIDECWGWLTDGEFYKVERALNTHMSTLPRFANTISPYQDIAANLAVQAMIMQIILATHKLDYVARVSYCVKAVQFGALSGDRNLHALALYWQGDTYTYCYNRPQTAIGHLNDALSNLEGNALLRSAIYSDLSIAHAQDKDETKALEYAVMARQAMPTYPHLDPFRQYIRMGPSELDQFEGKTYLYLAERFPGKDYARLAYGAFERSVSKLAVTKSKLGQAYIRKADAARALGDMDEFVKCWTDGFLIAIEMSSMSRLTQAHNTIHRIPETWQRETMIQDLQKDISQALIVARR